MIQVSEEVANAVAEARPVVALESTIFSPLGLPPPASEQALHGCVDAIRALGAVPAITAVLDGVAVVGVTELDRLFAPARKVSQRDLPVAVAQRWPFGATTVAAALHLAAAAGVAVFATGGIGGVHRDAAVSHDVSADLGAIASHPVVTVCAGAKAFLDLAATLEHLETLGVPVVGYRTDTFPAFTIRSSGLPVPVRADSVDELASIAAARRGFGGGGVLVAVPIPAEHALGDAAGEAAIAAALRAAAAAGVRGGAVTPYVLARVAEEAGDTLTANVALAINNAEVAAQLAGALSRALPR